VDVAGQGADEVLHLAVEEHQLLPGTDGDLSIWFCE